MIGISNTKRMVEDDEYNFNGFIFIRNIRKFIYKLYRIFSKTDIFR
ncbi:hypothetical protein LMANV2_70077 [Leptospira interrogans serovar Manilae]|uniref:Uncharacterized protein n=1 Tax=Leptospira interrogans serovar Manilae TaxID=214675 RepID=A0AAQ1P229_LEPIR|nr:hypothetical protein LMANV2_70077 [Leptospira interrogans serovar Manilae]